MFWTLAVGTKYSWTESRRNVTDCYVTTIRHNDVTTTRRGVKDTTKCHVELFVVWALLKVSTCSSAARRGSSSSATRVKISPSGDSSAVSFYQQVLRLKAFGPHHIIIVDLSKTLLFQLFWPEGAKPPHPKRSSAAFDRGGQTRPPRSNAFFSAPLTTRAQPTTVRRPSNDESDVIFDKSTWDRY